MANVDACIRYAEQGLCKNIEENSINIFNLKEYEKVNIFKNKSKNEIKDILYDCSENIKTYINNKYYDGKNNDITLIQENNNNKIEQI